LKPATEAQSDRLIQDAQGRINAQKARLHRLIVQGHPTQSADDILADLYVELRRLKRLRLEQ
jgi:hypothetical protein